MTLSHRALAAGCLAAALSGCGTLTSLEDDDAVDRSQAYAYLCSNVSPNGLPDGFKATLMRVDANGGRHPRDVKIAYGQCALVALAPGNYYLDEVRGRPLDFVFEPAQSLFVAKAGQVNYPGDWRVDVDLVRYNTVTSMRQTRFPAGLEEHAASGRQAGFERDYPLLSQRLKLVYTRVAAD